MSSTLELALKKQRLVLRSASLRQSLAADSQSLMPVFAAADKVVAGVHWLQERPVVVAAAATLVVLLKPRVVLRWGRRGFFAWRALRAVQARFGKQQQAG